MTVYSISVYTNFEGPSASLRPSRLARQNRILPIFEKQGDKGNIDGCFELEK